jgi:aspartate/methionine/tyrosine aminotransferase
VSAFATSLLVSRLAASRRAVPTLAPGTIRLDNGDPDFNTPEPIRAAHAAALAAGQVHYAHPQGEPRLREELAARVAARAGRLYDRDQVLVTHGATGGLTSAILAIVNQGDRVLLPEPTYSLYADLIAMAGGEPVYVPTRRPDFHLDLDALRAAAPGARAVIICNPCNPTGAVYERDELAGVARISRDHDFVVIADEAYDHIVYEPAGFTSFLEVAEAADRLVYVQTFSKTYSMTGWRLGYLAAPASLAQACARIHRTFNGPVNSAVQSAGLAALSIGPEWQDKMLEEYTQRRTIVLDILRGHSIDVRAPEGTFYVFVPHANTISSTRMAALAAEAGAAVRPGTEYGPSGEGFLRVAFSVSRDDLVVGLERLATAIRHAGAEPPAPRSGQRSDEGARRGKVSGTPSGRGSGS